MSQKDTALRTGALVITAILCGVLSGLILVWSLPPFGIWPLVFIGLIPMIIAQYRLVPRNWSWIPVSVMAFTYIYFAYSFHQSTLATGAWGWSAPAIVAVVIGPFAVLDRRISEHTGFKWFVLQMPVVWIGLDAARQNFPITGTMTNLAYALTHEAKLIEPVSVFGVYGLELLLVAVNYALALVVLRFVKHQKLAGLVPSFRVIVSLAAVVALAVVAWGVAGVQLYNSVQSSSGPTVRVAVIQPGSAYAAANAVSLPTAKQEAGFEAQLSTMTRQAAARRAQLVIWPEEYLPFNPATASASDRAWLQSVLTQNKVYIVTGFVDPLSKAAVDWVAYTYENDADLLSPQGKILATYTKQHQAPYDDDLFKAGTSSVSYQTRIGKIGMIICMDIAFQDPLRFSTLSGANIVGIPSWQSGGLGRMQWYDSAVFDAVEDRVPVALADHAWESLIVKADGQIVAADDNSSAAGRTNLMIGDVQLGPRNSPFLVLGNWVGEAATFALLIIVFCGVNCIWLERKQRREHSAATPDSTVS
jgi:apolipoprotein N-acyltransferase